MLLYLTFLLHVFSLFYSFVFVGLGPARRGKEGHGGARWGKFFSRAIYFRIELTLVDGVSGSPITSCVFFNLSLNLAAMSFISFDNRTYRRLPSSFTSKSTSDSSIFSGNCEAKMMETSSHD
jgi:hypothetical protein